MAEDPATPPAIGHNGIAGDHLRSFIERIERLEEEKAVLVTDIREVYAEAKGQGFDAKIMRAIVRERRLETQERHEREEMLDLYRQALGMISDLPLGQAALKSVGATI